MINDLIAHPEGGAYAERFRSPMQLTHPRLKAQRSAVTLIHFRLQHGDFSAWHKVMSEEIWLHAGGDGIELLTWDEQNPVSIIRVGAEDLADATTWSVVPSGLWQAARPLGNSALMHCVVAPGFDFADFQLLRDADAATQARLRHNNPAAAALI